MYQEQMTNKSLVHGINTLYQQRDALRDKMKSENVADAADKVARIIADA